MNSDSTISISSDVRQRLTVLFVRLIPLVDSMADTLRMVLIVALLFISWIAIWLFYLKHFPVAICLTLLALAALPLFILIRFWWSLEELKKLPGIIDTMMSDAKNEVKITLQEFNSGKKSTWGFFSASKGLWSISSMLRELRELIGSYISITTLINPFMLILGIASLLAVGGMGFISVVIVFFV